MARKTSGLVLMRHLLGNCSRSSSPSSWAGLGLGLVHHQQELIPFNSFRAQTFASIPSTKIIGIPCGFIRSRVQPFGSYRRLYSSVEDSFYEDDHKAWESIEVPANVVLVFEEKMYYDYLKKIEDERLPAVFYFSGGQPSHVRLYSILSQLCHQQYPHITIYDVEMKKNGPSPSMYCLKIYSLPTVRFYLNGEMVDELKSSSVVRLTKTLANVYSSSGVRKRRATSRAKKVDDEIELSESGYGAVEVAECSLPATSISKVMAEVESLPEAGYDGRLWWFAKGLFLSQEKRETFSKLEDPDLKIEWLRREVGVSLGTGEMDEV